jgi:hypothetical protein
MYQMNNAQLFRIGEVKAMGLRAELSNNQEMFHKAFRHKIISEKSD